MKNSNQTPFITSTQQRSTKNNNTIVITTFQDLNDYESSFRTNTKIAITNQTNLTPLPTIQNENNNNDNKINNKTIFNKTTK